MKTQDKFFVRIHGKAHRDLKILSALTGRAMGDLVEDMIVRFKTELAGGKAWGDDVYELIAESERQIKETQSVFDRRKQRAENKKRVLEAIVKLRDEKGLTFEEIAAQLQTDGYQTLSGKGEWQFGTVHKLYKQLKKTPAPTLLEVLKRKAIYGGILDE